MTSELSPFPFHLSPLKEKHGIFAGLSADKYDRQYSDVYLVKRLVELLRAATSGRRCKCWAGRCLFAVTGASFIFLSSAALQALVNGRAGQHARPVYRRDHRRGAARLRAVPRAAGGAGARARARHQPTAAGRLHRGDPARPELLRRGKFGQGRQPHHQRHARTLPSTAVHQRHHQPVRRVLDPVHRYARHRLAADGASCC